MIAGLQKIDPLSADEIDKPMLLGQPARPEAGRQILQRLGLALSGKGIPQDGFNKMERAERDFSVRFDPIAQVLDELGLEDGFTLFCPQAPPRDAVCQET